MVKIRTYKAFMESESKGPDWAGLEDYFANMQNPPDCIPTNVREWESFKDAFDSGFVKDVKRSPLEVMKDTKSGDLQYVVRAMEKHGVMLKDFGRRHVDQILEMESDSLWNSLSDLSDEFADGIWWDTQRYAFARCILMGEYAALDALFNAGYEWMNDTEFIDFIGQDAYTDNMDSVGDAVRQAINTRHTTAQASSSTRVILTRHSQNSRRWPPIYQVNGLR